MKIIKFILFIFIFNNIAFAHYDTAYWSELGTTQNRSNWMDWIPDSMHLSELSLPGTHDTMTGGVGLIGHDIARTQSMSLYNQLVSGIRVLDIRAKYNGDSFPIHHGSIKLGMDFDFVLSVVQDFLRKNPTESVFMRFKQEDSSASDVEMEILFKKYYDKYKDIFWVNTNESNDPQMGEFRGKLVLLADVLSLEKYGLSYRDIDKQDAYHLNTNWDLYAKWEKIKVQINKSNKGVDTIYMNYLSGSGGSFPYFVASGHSSPGISAGRLITGFTEPGWKGIYPDFPRGAYFGVIATIYFEGTNTLTADYLKKYKISLAGMVMADFPGERLINAIIDCNLIKIEQKGLQKRDNNPKATLTYQPF